MQIALSRANTLEYSSFHLLDSTNDFSSRRVPGRAPPGGRAVEVPLSRLIANAARAATSMLPRCNGRRLRIEEPRHPGMMRL